MNRRPILDLTNIYVVKNDDSHIYCYDVWDTIYHGIVNPSELSDLENSCELLDCHFSRKSNDPIPLAKMRRKVWKRYLKTHIKYIILSHFLSR